MAEIITEEFGVKDTKIETALYPQFIICDGGGIGPEPHKKSILIDYTVIAKLLTTISVESEVV